MDMWLVTLILGEIALFTLLIWVASNHFTKRRHLRSEERLKILGRFSSGEELTQFLESEVGRKYLDTFSDRPDPLRAVARTVQGGIILAFLGLGFLTLYFFGHQKEATLIAGTLLTMAAVGVLLGAGISARMAHRSGPR